jgi:hypothetical protein
LFFTTEIFEVAKFTTLAPISIVNFKKIVGLNWAYFFF